MSSSSSVRTILLFESSPINVTHLRLDEEERVIDEALRHAQQRDRFELKQRHAVRTHDLQSSMLEVKPNIVHFCGHGTGEEGLVFQDETGRAKLVSTDALANLFRLFDQTVECVVLNACYAEVQAEAISKHIRYVVGMHQAIGDQAAIEFSRGFYQALGAGEPIERAFEFGCSAIQLEGIPEHLTPVLKKNSEISLPTPDGIPGETVEKPAKPDLVEALLACSTMQNRQKRDTIVKNLPANVRNNITRRDDTISDVTEIVETCSEYPNGIEELVRRIEFHENGTIAMRNVHELFEKAH